jgi:hypothetical protein
MYRDYPPRFTERFTRHEQPVSATRWSKRTLVAHPGLSATTIRRI